MTIYSPPATVPFLALVLRYLLLPPVLLYGIVATRTNWTCDRLYDDVPSRTALSTIVFEGRARRVEPLPSWVKQVDREHFNVTFKPKNLYKGDLPRTPEGSFGIITVGVFGVVENRSACVPSVQLGSRYLVFLHGHGTPSEYNRLLSFYQIFSFPEPFTPEAASQAAEYGCPNCTSLPNALLSAGDVEIRLKQKLQLCCLVTGRPYPNTTWYKNGQQLVAAKRVRLRKSKCGFSLRVSKVKAEDAGSYSCHAYSVLGEAHSNASIVSIAPSPTFVRPHAALCSTQSFCLNGGICYTIPSLGRKFCQCNHNFSGLRCQDREHDSLIRRFLDGRHQLELETILLAAILAVAIILLITLLSLVCTICRMHDKYSKVLLNSSRSKQSLRLDRMVALATVNHLPSYCDTSVQTDPIHANELMHSGVAEAASAAPVLKKYAMCVTTRHNQQTRSTSVPTGCGIATASGCKLTSPNSASSAGCNQHLSEVFVSNGRIAPVVTNIVKQTGCNHAPNVVFSQNGCNRLSSGSGITVGCNSHHSSSSNCNKDLCQPASSIVTLATVCCEPASNNFPQTANCKGDLCVPMTAAATGQGPVPAIVSPSTGCCHEPCTATSGVSCCAVPCGDIQLTGYKLSDNEAKPNLSPKCHTSGFSERNSVTGADDAEVTVCAVLQSLEDASEKRLPSVVQECDLECSAKLTPTNPAVKHLQRTKNSGGNHSSPNTRSTTDDCDNNPPQPDFPSRVASAGTCETNDLCSHHDSDCLNLDPEVGHQRSVHTVPKHSSSLNSKRNILSEHCSSDYERNSPASDLEVNMESEVDIQALNASEEELGRELGQSRLFFHNNYESSVDTTDSESSVSSHEQDQLLLNRLKSQQSHLMDSSTEERASGGASAADELDWEKFSCPFNFGALDHTFTLNPYDVIYASKYLARNHSKTDSLGAEGATSNEPPLAGPDQYPYDPDPVAGPDQYPYDPDPDATVV